MSSALKATLPSSVEWMVVVKDSTVRLYSENFKHDACLILQGDFESIETKTAYAQDLAERLNTHSLMLPLKETFAKEKALQTNMQKTLMLAFKTVKLKA